MIDTQDLAAGVLELAESLASGRSLDDRLRDLCRTTVRLLGCDRSSIFLWQDGYFRARYNFGNPPDIAARFPHHRVRRRDPLIAEAFSRGSFVVLNDVASSDRIDPETARLARIRAIVVAPLADPEREPLGFLTAEYNENLGEFTHMQSTLVLGFANLASLAILEDRREREARDLAEQRRQAERLEAIGSLAAGIAHDFNNLLTVILGHGAALATELDGEPSLREQAVAIEKAAERASALTRQLLAFGRAQLLQPVVVDLDAVIGNLVPMLRRLLPASIELVKEPPCAQRLVKADRGQLEQVIVNLCVNARDAMPAGGTLSLATSETTLDPDLARRHPTLPPGTYVLLTITDTGVGMDAGTAARVFEPFFSTKEPGRGSGLGLATVHGIVRQSHGSVAVRTEPGHGTCFEVLLPRSAGAIETTETRSPARSVGRRARILVVEDDPMLLSLTSRLLEREGHQVVSAASPREAIERASGSTPSFDLLVSDVMLPGCSGPALAVQLRALHPELRLIFVSGYAETDAIPDDADLRGAVFLAKPFSPAHLADAVRGLLGAETHPEA